MTRWEHLGVKRLNDAKGLIVETLYDIQLRGGTTVPKGTVTSIVQVWRGKLTLGHLSDVEDGHRTMRVLVRQLEPEAVMLRDPTLATAPTPPDEMPAPAGAREVQRPTRKDLLRVVGELQDLIGQARAAYENDRGKERAHAVQSTLNEAFDLCVLATSMDPPISGKWP